MRYCYSEAVKQINATIENIRVKAAETGQETFVSLYLFGGRETVTRVFHDKPIAEVSSVSTYFAEGGTTPLFDAIGTAIDDGRCSPAVNDPNASFLVVCATDGGENGSNRYGNQYNTNVISRLIADVQGTDRWTLAFMVPPGKKYTTMRMGIPEGNITEWTNDVRGAREGFTRTSVATEAYYNTRSAGLKSTKSFYTTNLSTLSKTELSQMLDVSGRFKKWNVDREVELKTFVEAKGIAFVIGASYYPVTKKELLRTGRNVLVREKGTTRIYGGSQARTLLGIPAGEVMVTPGNHGNYDIFFQSTSTNRHLVRGTELLFDLTHQPGMSQETWDRAAAEAAAAAKKAAGLTP